MIKEFKNFVLSLVFPKGYVVGGSKSRNLSIDLEIGNKSLEDLENTLKIWEFARKIESAKNGKVRCSFRENDGTLRKPVRMKHDHKGSFVLYVSKRGKPIASYEIEFLPDGYVSIFSAWVHGENTKESLSQKYELALGSICIDIDKRSLHPGVRRIS